MYIKTNLLQEKRFFVIILFETGGKYEKK